MKKSTIIFTHIGYWVTYIFFTLGTVASSRGFKFDESIIAPVLGRICFGAAYFYAFYFFLVPRFLAKRKSRRFLFAGIGLSLLAPPFELMYQFIMVDPPPSFVDVQGPWQEVVTAYLYVVVVFIFYAFMAFVNGMMGAIMKGFITWYDEIHIKEILMRKNLQTELALLKAQINPHFLFNTLNNIDVLIEKKASIASDYLKKLSDILRFSLYDTREEKIPLRQELEYIRKFIDLQQMRSATAFVDLNVSGDPDNLTIAPMIFIPFIENAFKHSTNKKIDNAIKIKIAIENSNVQFTCLNVIDKDSVVYSQKSGLGLDLIRQRLQLLYKDSHSLAIETNHDIFNVSLKLNLNAN